MTSGSVIYIFTASAILPRRRSRNSVDLTARYKRYWGTRLGRWRSVIQKKQTKSGLPAALSRSLKWAGTERESGKLLARGGKQRRLRSPQMNHHWRDGTVA